MINVDIGTLNRRVQILTHDEYVDEYGLTHQTLVDAIGNEIWARIEPLRGREFMEADKYKDREIYKVTIRYRSTIKPSMLVKYQNMTMEITNVIDPYMQHVKLELMCQLAKRGADDEN